MQITLQVEPTLAVALRSHDKRLEDARARQVIDLVRTARASLQAMHPESQDVDLGRYFTIDVGDTEAPALQDSLLQSKGVTAAYIQPAEELP